MNLIPSRLYAAVANARRLDPRAIIALSLLAASIMLIGAIAAIWALRIATLRDESTHLANVSVLLAEQTARAVDGVDMLLRIGADIVEHGADAQSAVAPEALRERLAELVRRAPQVRAIAVVRADGSVWLQTRSESAIDFAPIVGEHLAVNRAKQPASAYIGAPVHGHDGRAGGVPLSRPIESPGGGVIIGWVASGYFEGLYRALVLGSRGQVALVRTDGQVLASDRNSEDNRAPDAAVVQRWLARLGAETHTATIEAFDGDWRLAGVARVAGFPLVVATEVPRDALLNSWRRLAAFFAGGALLASAVVVGFGMRLARHMRTGSRLESQLRSSEDRLHAIIESAMDAIITVDVEQRIVLFNGTAEALFGLPAAAAIGGPLDRLIPERFRQAHRGHIERFGVAGTTTRHMGGRTVLYGLRVNGSEFPIDASISQVVVEGTRFYTVILRDVTAQIAAEAEIQRGHKELAELSRVAQEALEEERRRVARELHDELGQSLTAIKMDMQSVQQMLPEEPQALRERCEKIRGLVDDTVAATRRIASDLRPLMLDDLGLGAAVDWLVQGFAKRTGINATLDVDEAVGQIGEPAASALFRIVQESLTNVARHADAKNVSVRLRQEGDRAVVTVTDDGKGISAADQTKHGSFGLRGIRERARLLGGRAEIASPAHGGAVVTAHLPLAAESARSIA